MAIRLRIGQEIPNGFSRLIEQALHPKDFRHKGAAQGRIVHPGPRDFGPLHDGGGAPLDPSGVGQRFAVLTKEIQPKEIQPKEIQRDTDYLAFLGLTEAPELIRAKKLSPVEYVTALLARIERHDGKYNAFIALAPERALTAARTVEAEIAAGRWRGSFHPIRSGTCFNSETRDFGIDSGTGSRAGYGPDEPSSSLAFH
jgi:hypothetical protein